METSKCKAKITIQVHKYSSKASLNKNVFKFFLKLGKDGERRTSDGNEFHKVAAANLKSIWETPRGNLAPFEYLLKY